MRKIGDETFEDLIGLADAQELCRRLLGSPFGWRRSTRHQEAVELLASVSGASEVTAAFVALLVCTCQRWDRVTARVITALEQSELLGASELDELAEALLIHEHVVSYPLAPTSPEWLKIEIELDDGTGDTGKVSEDTVAHHRRGVEPPLRRWAARRALGADPDRLEQLLDGADLFDARHRDAVIHGLIDAADVLDEPQRRTVLGRGLDGGQSSVRLAALDLLCELDGLDAARGRADQDRNATVRKWTPPSELTHPTLL